MDTLKRVFGAVGREVAHRPFVTLLVALLVVGVAVGGASQITSVTGDKAFVGEDPTLDTFSESFDRETMAVLIRGDVTSPETMRAIDRFDRRVSEVEDVETVITPADRLRKRYGRIPESKADIEAVVGDSDSTLVTVVLTTDLTQEEQRPIYQKAVEAKSWAAFPAGSSVIITGQPAFSAQLSELISQSTSQLLGLAVGLMVVALFLLFRGVRLRLLPIVAVFVGVVYTFGAIGYAGIPNSTLTSAVFPILIGLGIDYSVQFHQRYEEELERNPPREALPRALEGIGSPVLVAMLAAALGFGATWLSTAGTPAFVWFAQTSIFGVVLTFLTSIVVLLPLLTLYVRWTGGDDTAVDRDSGTDDDGVGAVGRFIGKFSRTVASYPAVVICLAGLLMVGGMYASTSLDTLADTEEFVPDDLPAYLDLQQFRDETGGGTSVQYDVLVSGSHLRDPETLRWMLEFEEVADDKVLILGVSTPASAVERYNGGELPGTEAGVDRVLERMPPEERLQYYNDGYAHIVVVGQQGMSTQQVISFIDNTREAIAISQPPPGVDAELTGSSVLSPPSIVDQIESRNGITALGVLFVFGLLFLYYRHPVKATAPLVPMLFVIGWQGLYMKALGIAVSPLGASLGALSVGIGAEYTIIVMERYYEERENGSDPLEAVEIAGRRVGTAISISGMTTVFGFSALTLSPFPILSDFGYLTVGVIFLTLVAALVTLPPTLVVLDELAADVSRRFGQGAESTAS